MKNVFGRPTYREGCLLYPYGKGDHVIKVPVSLYKYIRRNGCLRLEYNISHDSFQLFWRDWGPSEIYPYKFEETVWHYEKEDLPRLKVTTPPDWKVCHLILDWRLTS